jgi:hypothetical protein
MWNLYITFCLIVVNNAQLGVRMRRYEIFCNSTITNMVAARKIYVMSDRSNMYSICSYVLSSLSRISKAFMAGNYNKTLSGCYSCHVLKGELTNVSGTISVLVISPPTMRTEMVLKKLWFIRLSTT